MVLIRKLIKMVLLIQKLSKKIDQGYFPESLSLKLFQITLKLRCLNSYFNNLNWKKLEKEKFYLKLNYLN